MKRKCTATILALLLLLACLAGCGGAPEATPTPEATPSATPEPSAEPEATTAPARDFSGAYAALSPETVVMTVNGLDVTWGEYFYWLHAAVESLEAYYGAVENFDALFELDAEGRSYGDYVLYYADAMVTQYRVLEGQAADLGVSLTDADREELAAQWENDVVTYGEGDETTFLAYLESMYMDRALYDYINQVSALYYNCFVEQYGERGEKCSDDVAQAYADANEYIQVKHILFRTVDDAGEALPEEEKAAKRQAAEDAAAALNAAADKNARMDELMAQTEDTGTAYYPNGYVFTRNQMVAAFEEAAYALAEGEVSGVVETDYGYHVILRLPLSLDDTVSGQYYSEEEQYSLRYNASAAAYDADVGARIENADVQRLPALEELDMQAVFNG